MLKIKQLALFLKTHSVLFFYLHSLCMKLYVFKNGRKFDRLQCSHHNLCPCCKLGFHWTEKSFTSLKCFLLFSSISSSCKS